MLHGKKVSVAAPVLNEEFFIKGWLKNVAMFADEVVVTDGGSQDSTVLQITEFSKSHDNIAVDLRVKPQTGQPYSDDWGEGDVRNDLLDRCSGEFIVLLDADELVRPNDIEDAIKKMLEQEANRATMKLVPFWGDFNHVRVKTKEDPRWMDVPVARIVRKGMCRYNTAKHHSGLAGDPVVALDSPLFHTHYAFGPTRLKERDNRLYDFSDHPIEKPVVEAYHGPWPNDIETLYT